MVREFRVRFSAKNRTFGRTESCGVASRPVETSPVSYNPHYMPRDSSQRNARYGHGVGKPRQANVSDACLVASPGTIV